MAVALAHDEIVQLTLDSTGVWEEVTISDDYASIPNDASGVFLIFVSTASSADQIGCRPNGNTSHTILYDLESSNKQSAVCGCDGDQKIRIYRETSDFDVYLVGYLEADEFYQIASPIDVSPTSYKSTQTVDVDTPAPNDAVFAVVEAIGPSTRDYAFAYAGVDPINDGYSNMHSWAIVPLNGSNEFSCEIENVADIVYLVGFITVGDILATRTADLVASTSTGSWQTITVPDSSKEIAICEVVSKTANRMFDLSGTTTTSRPAALYDDAYDSSGIADIFPIDGSNQGSVKIESGDTEIYVWGYLAAAAAGGTTYQGSATDGFDMGETIANIATFQAVGTDGLSMGETPDNIATMLSTGVDGLDFSDALSSIATMLSTGADGLDLSDAVFNIATMRPVATDGVAFGETTQSDIKIVLTAIDGFKFSETIDTAAAWQAVGVDGVNLSDALAVIATLQAAGTDGVDLSDALAAVQTLIALATDGIDLTDLSSGEILSGILGVAIDGFTLSDATIARANFEVICTDGIAFSESLSAIMTLVATAIDAFSLSDLAVSAEVTSEPGKVIISISASQAKITISVKQPKTDVSIEGPITTIN